MIGRIHAHIVLDRPLKVNIGTPESPDFVEDEDALYLLQMCHLCKEYRVLPQAGGLNDQDSLFVYVLGSFTSAVAERQKREAEQAQRNVPKR